MSDTDRSYYVNASKQASEREIQTVDAERTSINYKQVEYLQNYIGDTFDAVVSGVSDYGLFVEEVTTKAQGLIRLRDLGDDFFEVDRKNYAIVGQKSGQKFTIGDNVKVKLTAADLDRRQVDFELV